MHLAWLSFRWIASAIFANGLDKSYWLIVKIKRTFLTPCVPFQCQNNIIQLFQEKGDAVKLKAWSSLLDRRVLDNLIHCSR